MSGPLPALLVVCLLVVGCSPAGVASRVGFIFDHAPQAIYGPEDAARWIDEWRVSDCGDGEPCNDVRVLRQMAQLPGTIGEFWRPDSADVIAFARQIRVALRRGNADNSRDQPGPLREYAVQFIGFEEGGRRLIYARGLRCHDRDSCQVGDAWRILFDGGTRVFHATYDPATEELVGIGFNGYA